LYYGKHTYKNIKKFARSKCDVKRVTQVTGSH
jgi:hypothetical protein